MIYISGSAEVVPPKRTWVENSLTNKNNCHWFQDFRHIKEKETMESLT